MRAAYLVWERRDSILETEASRAAWKGGVRVAVVVVGCSVVEWREVGMREEPMGVEGVKAVVEVRRRRMGAREVNLIVIECVYVVFDSIEKRLLGKSRDYDILL